MSAHLHVGFVTGDLSAHHGWGRYSLSLIRALQAAGVELTVVVARNSPSVDGIPAVPLLPPVAPPVPFTLPRLIVAAPQAWSLLRACHVIHAAIEPYAPLAAWVAGRRPLFVTGHGSYVMLGQRRRWPVGALYRWAFRKARLVCVSRYTAHVAQETLPGVQTIVVNNGIEAERFANLPPLDMPKRGPTVLCVGAVKARKGTLELVRAMQVVRERVPGAQCVIIGDLEVEPSYVETVRRAIASLGLDDCVHLLGRVPEETKLAWYGAANVFVLPAIKVGWRFEGYGLAYLEASAAGLPVIGTTECGAEDAIDDGVTGLLVPQEHIAEKLPEAIIALLTDPQRAARMGAAGRAKAQRQSWDGVARQMIELYRAALEP